MKLHFFIRTLEMKELINDRLDFFIKVEEEIILAGWYFIGSWEAGLRKAMEKR